MSSDGYNLGNAYGRIIITDNIDEAVQQAQRSFDRGIRGMGQSLQQLGDQFTGIGARITALTAPLTVFGASGIRTAMDFDDAMAEISARTGLVGEDLNQIATAAKQMGAETVFSSQQAAQAFLELLSSGQSAEEALQTLPHVLTAAAAGGIDLGTAADTVTDILAAFQLEVGDAEMVVDALAQAASSSSADITSLQQGFSNVGPVANQFGLDVEDVAAVLAIFSENGIKGAEAGTQLRSMLMNMTRQTDAVTGAWDTLGISVYDADGNMRDLNDIMVDLNGVMESGTFTQEEMNKLLTDIGGSYGIMGLSALSAGMSIEDMQASMAGQADAASVADARMNTFSGTMNSLGGSIETLQIAVLTPFMNEVLKPLAQQAIEIVNRMTAWAEANPELTKTLVVIGAAIAALGPVLIGIGLAISTVGAGIAGLATVFGLLLSPIGLVIGAVGALAWHFRDYLPGSFEEAQTVAKKVFGRLRKTFENLYKRVEPLLTEMGEFFGNLFDGLDLGQIAQAGMTIMSLTSPIGWVVQALKGLGVDFGAVFDDIVGKATAFFAALNDGGTVFDGLRAAFGESGFIDAVEQGFGRVVNFVQTVVIPGLNQLKAWFIEDALPAVVDFVKNTALPAVQNFIGFLGQVWAVVGPALANLASWFMETALPAAMDFVTNTVMPALQDFVGFLTRIWEVAKPHLMNIVGWFVETGLPLAVGFIEDFVMPALNTLGGWLETIWGVVSPLIEPLITWFLDTGLGAVHIFLRDVLGPALDTLQTFLVGMWGVVEGPLNTLQGVFETVFGFIVDDVILPLVRLLGGEAAGGEGGNTLLSIIEGLAGVIEGPLNTAKGVFETVFGLIEEPIQSVIDLIGGIPDAINGALETVNGVIEDIEGAVGGVIDGAGDLLDDANPLTGSGFLAGLPIIGDKRDSGGVGQRGGLYNVGPSQIGHEAFIAGDNGHFYPDFAKQMARIAGNVVRSAQMRSAGRSEATEVSSSSVTETSLSQPQTVIDIGNITIHADDRMGGEAAADGFVDRLQEKFRLRGL